MQHSSMMVKQMKFHDIRLNKAYHHIEHQSRQISALKKLTATGLDSSQNRIAAVENLKQQHRITLNIMQRQIKELQGKINQITVAYQARVNEHF